MICIRNSVVHRSGGRVRLSTAVDAPSELGLPRELWLEVPERFEGFVSESADGPLAAVLLRLSDALHVIQTIHWRWDRRSHRVTVTPGRTSLPAADRRGDVGLFFSGGVDSLYTLHQNLAQQQPAREERIRHLLFVHWLGHEAENPVLRAELMDRFERLAVQVDCSLMPLRTNVAQFCRAPLDWGRHFHGAALAFVALSLGHGLGRVFISSSDPYEDLFIPWGTHPLLDPLWSTEATEIVHFGNEADRLDKLRAIQDWEPGMRALSVCQRNTAGADNCCRCEKCLRTMMMLHITGGLRNAPTFPLPLDPKAVARLRITFGEAEDANSLPILRNLTNSPYDRALKRALLKARRRGRHPIIRAIKLIDEECLYGMIRRTHDKLTGR